MKTAYYFWTQFIVIPSHRLAHSVEVSNKCPHLFAVFPQQCQGSISDTVKSESAASSAAWQRRSPGTEESPLGVSAYIAIPVCVCVCVFTSGLLPSRQEHMPSIGGGCTTQGAHSLPVWAVSCNTYTTHGPRTICTLTLLHSHTHTHTSTNTLIAEAALSAFVYTVKTANISSSAETTPIMFPQIILVFFFSPPLTASLM